MEFYKLNINIDYCHFLDPLEENKYSTRSFNKPTDGIAGLCSFF